MFKNGFTTIGENFVKLVAIGAVVFVLIAILNTGSGNSHHGDLMGNAIDVLKWLVNRLLLVLLVTVTLILGTVYAIAEVFSRRNYQPIMSRPKVNINQHMPMLGQAQPAGLLHSGDDDHLVIEGTAIEGGVAEEDPQDIF